MTPKQVSIRSRSSSLIEAVPTSLSRDTCLEFLVGVSQLVPEQVVVMELSRVPWDAFGTPDRIVDTLRSIGKRPAFWVEYPPNVVPMMRPK